MARKLKVEYGDGRVVEIVAGPRAQVALERQFSMSVADMERVEHLYYLAWAALHFAGQEPKDFDAFLARIEDVHSVGDDKADDVDPTQPDQSPES